MSAPNGRGVPSIAARVEREDYGFEALSLEELRALWDEELREKDGECCCPVLEGGVRGFRQRCPVHGGRSRDDFARLTALRCEIALRLRVPSPAGGVIGGKERSK